MGNCLPVTGAKKVHSKNYFVPNESKPGQGYEAVRDFAKLKLDQEVIDDFYNVFVEVDKDYTGLVDLDEFYRFFDIDRSSFADRVFSIMDEDASGEITFREFVITMWNYCSMDIRALLRFSFDLFDSDLSGYLDMSEVYELLSEVYGDMYDQNHRLTSLMRELDSNGDEQVGFDEFKKINDDYPSMLFPAFRMQRKLRTKVFGEAFWVAQLRSRLQLGTAASPSIWEILANVRDARARIHRESKEQLEQQRYRAPGGAAGAVGGEAGASGGTYRPTPTLSDLGKRDPKIAQIELLQRAEKGRMEREVIDKRRKQGIAAARATLAAGPGGAGGAGGAGTGGKGGGAAAGGKQGGRGRSAAQKGTVVAGAVKGKQLHEGFADSGTVALKGKSGKTDAVLGQGGRPSALQNRLYRSSNFADGIA